MDVIMHHQNEFRSSSSQSEKQFSFWVSRNRAVLAFQSASLIFFFFFMILLSFRVDLSSFFSLGRTHMFILCNGIVAILVKGSVLADPNEDGEVELKKMKNAQVYEEKSVENEKKIVGIEEQGEKYQKTEIESILIVEREKIDEELVEEDLQEERKEEDGFDDELSIEELNKKCDEFIRRMRGVISNEN